jgi:dCMP deaminase
MSRPSRQEALMQCAYVWAKRSTCSRLNVGCVVHREGRILVQGYNGAPAGLPHCNHDCNCIFRGRPDHHPECNSQEPCTRAVHAEQNAVAFAARYGVELEGAHVMVTHQPCLSCAMSLINAGILSVHYVEPYRLLDGVNLLEESGIKVIRMLDFPVSA